MFTLGIQFSLREVMQYRAVALLGGVGITIVVVGLGALVALALGTSAEEAVVIGMATSVGSSMVASRLLEDRGVIGAPAGRIAIVLPKRQRCSLGCW
jgi:CPA2 family monovalent cation:H+ antiporter-2